MTFFVLWRKLFLFFHIKRYFDDGAIAEMKLWQVPRPVTGSRHLFKYSLFYGYPGIRLVGYDYEAGKGDHRHFGLAEYQYLFTSPEDLLRDFEAEVEMLRSKDSQEGRH